MARQFYNPNTGDTVSFDDSQLNTPMGANKVTELQRLTNSGYVEGGAQRPSPAPTTSLTVPSSQTATSSQNFVTPTTLTSGPANQAVDDLTKRLNDKEASIISERERLRQETQRRQAEEEARIRAQYDIKRQNLTEAQTSETASQKALNFRLGRSDTDYATSSNQELSKAQAYKMSLLAQEENEFINRAKQAIADDDYKKAREFEQSANEAFNQRLQISQEMRAREAADLDRIYKTGQLQKMQQEILKDNLSSYASGFVDFDESGNVVMATPEELQSFSVETGIPYQQLVGAIRTKAYELSKLSQEDRKRELDISNAQRQMIPQLFQEYEYAQQQYGFDGTFQDYLKSKNEADTTAPSSYKEWQLAGGQTGTGKTYAEFLSKNVEETGKYTPKQNAFISSLNNAVSKNATYSKTMNMRTFADNVTASLAAGNGVSDIAAINQFQKVIDEGAVTRDQDVKLIQGAQSLADALKLRIKKLQKGDQLSPEQRTQMRTLVESLYESQLKALKKDPYIKSKTIEAGNNGVEIIDTILGELESFGIGQTSYESLDEFTRNASQEELNQFNGLKKLYPNGTPQELWDIYQEENFNQPVSGGPNSLMEAGMLGGLGRLSAQFESSGDPGIIGYDKKGGLSYGIYQLAHSNAQDFVNQSSYKNTFAGIPFNSKAWQNKWKEVAKRDPEGFGQAQHDYIARTHYTPQVNKLARSGINVGRYSPVLQDVIFSTAVQHGPETDVVEKAFSKVGRNATEKELIKAIYNERWSGGKRFAGSESNVKQSVYNRFFGRNGELNKALSMLS